MLKLTPGIGSPKELRSRLFERLSSGRNVGDKFGAGSSSGPLATTVMFSRYITNTLCWLIWVRLNVKTLFFIILTGYYFLVNRAFEIRLQTSVNCSDLSDFQCVIKTVLRSWTIIFPWFYLTWWYFWCSAVSIRSVKLDSSSPPSSASHQRWTTALVEAGHHGSDSGPPSKQVLISLAFFNTFNLKKFTC